MSGKDSPPIHTRRHGFDPAGELRSAGTLTPITIGSGADAETTWLATGHAVGRTTGAPSSIPRIFAPAGERCPARTMDDHQATMRLVNPYAGVVDRNLVSCPGSASRNVGKRCHNAV